MRIESQIHAAANMYILPPEQSDKYRAEGYLPFIEGVVRILTCQETGKPFEQRFRLGRTAQDVEAGLPQMAESVLPHLDHGDKGTIVIRLGMERIIEGVAEQEGMLVSTIPLTLSAFLDETPMHA